MASRKKTRTAKASSGKKAKKKATKKKTTKKKATKKKGIKKKSTARKKAARKTVRKPAAGKRTVRPKSAGIVQKTIEIEPGPPAITVPPVEEPAPNEMAIGTVTHYYSHLGVAVVQVNTGVLKTGDMVHFKGHTTDFTQMIESMEYEHQHTEQAGAGQAVGLKVSDHTREHDIVYLVK